MYLSFVRPQKVVNEIMLTKYFDFFFCINYFDLNILKNSSLFIFNFNKNILDFKSYDTNNIIDTTLQIAYSGSRSSQLRRILQKNRLEDTEFNKWKRAKAKSLN